MKIKNLHKALELQDKIQKLEKAISILESGAPVEVTTFGFNFYSIGIIKNDEIIYSLDFQETKNLLLPSFKHKLDKLQKEFDQL